MSRTVSPSTAEPYGTERVARLWGVARATVYRHRRPSEGIVRGRPGPRGAMADEDLELVSRGLGVTAAELSGWREAFLAAGEVSLKSRPADARDGELGRLKEKVGELTMANELLGAKVERLEAGRPLARRRSRR